MPVSVPTGADVRKVRAQAAKDAGERAEAARTPLLAVLGAGDAAVTAVAKAVVESQARGRAQADRVQSYVTTLPKKLTAAELRDQAEATYADLAERGEKTWGRIRKQPQVSHAIARIEAYTERFDARVDGLVDDAHDVATRTLALVTRKTRATGEKTAHTAEKVADATAQTVVDVAGDLSARIDEAGDEAAHAARSNARKAANRTAPTTAPKPTTPRSGGH